MRDENIKELKARRERFHLTFKYVYSFFLYRETRKKNKKDVIWREKTGFAASFIHMQGRFAEHNSQQLK